MLQLREQIQQMNEIIAQLNAKINPNSADAVRLNPKQQVSEICVVVRLLHKKSALGDNESPLPHYL